MIEREREGSRQRKRKKRKEEASFGISEIFCLLENTLFLDIFY